MKGHIGFCRITLGLNAAPNYCDNCRPENSGEGKLSKRNCLSCKIEFLAAHAKYCNPCRKIRQTEIALLSVQTQAKNRRSKNEKLFAELCQNKFEQVKENAPIFDGWDADIVLMQHKIAVMWNGIWHYKKVKKEHSVKQVQNRDRIKLSKITEAGYTPYIIKDTGSFNPVFVQDEFQKFLIWMTSNSYSLE